MDEEIRKKIKLEVKKRIDSQMGSSKKITYPLKIVQNEIKDDDISALDCSLTPEIIQHVTEILQLLPDPDSFTQDQCSKSVSRSESVCSVSSFSSMIINHDFPDQFLETSHIKYEDNAVKSLYEVCVPFMEKCKLKEQRQKLMQRIRDNIKKKLEEKIDCTELLCCLEGREVPNKLIQDDPLQKEFQNNTAMRKLTSDENFHKPLKHRTSWKDTPKLLICSQEPINEKTREYFEQMILNENRYLQESLEEIFDETTGRLEVPDILSTPKMKFEQSKSKFDQLFLEINLSLKELCPTI